MVQKNCALRTLALLIFLISSPSFLFSQPKIDVAGDNWAGKVKEGIELVKSIDTFSYGVLMESCNRVSFWMGDFSSFTVNDKKENVILISVNDMKYGSVNNIAAILVHESIHLWIKDNGEGVNEIGEEITCYTIELEFLQKIPGVEPELIDHAKLQIQNYKNKLAQK